MNSHDSSVPRYMRIESQIAKFGIGQEPEFDAAGNPINPADGFDTSILYVRTDTGDVITDPDTIAYIESEHERQLKGRN